VSGLARWCFHRRWLVLGFWMIALLGTFAAARDSGTAFATKFELPNADSTKALALLQEQFPAAAGGSDQIVVHTPNGLVTDAAAQRDAQKMLATVAALPHVTSVTSPYAEGGSKRISADGRTAFATVTFDEQPQDLPAGAVKKVIKTAQAASSDHLQVALGGQDIENAEGEPSSKSTLGGVFLALIVLVIAFGALFSAFLPLITALVAIGIGYSLTGLLSHTMSIASFATVLGLLIGLGVGVDYALFIVTRHRAAVRRGKSLEDAAAEAINTAGRAVFFAGITVCIALLGQFALGLSFLYGIAISAALTVMLTMLASLTLLPALLGFFGMKVFSRRQRANMRETGPIDEVEAGLWYRWARFIERRPKLPATIALLIVVGLALPMFTLRLGLDDASSDPAGSTTNTAYHLLADGFGPGFNGPFLLVGKLASAGDASEFQAVTQKLANEPGVAAVTPAVVSPSGNVAIASLYPSTSPQSAQTSALLDRLRNTVIPRAQSGTAVDVLVGGTTAIQTDFTHILAAKLPLFVGVVVLFGFLLLMVVFRSLLVPLVASVMNLLAVGAALGIMNAVFEWGWGDSFLRITTTAPVFVFVPVLMISILFGLSMDYEVFLVSRIHEEWAKGSSNSEAVTLGQAATGRVITAAAAIMILVFGSFALGDQVVIKQFGIGLAGAVFVDAFLIRTALVPALMHLFGEANWWLPGWLDRIIPQLNVEGAEPAHAKPAPAAV
jgi:putative drug exporter of the RND superfamily